MKGDLTDKLFTLISKWEKTTKRLEGRIEEYENESQKKDVGGRVKGMKDCKNQLKNILKNHLYELSRKT